MMLRLALPLVMATAFSFAADPFAGQWKLNPTSSKSGSGQPLTDVVMTWAQEGDAVRVTTRGTRPDRTPFKETYVAVYDGQERASKGPWNFDSVINKVVSDREREAIFKRGGKVVGRTTLALSSDGKRLTQTIHFDGETSLRVYDRQ